jgi:Pyruvate/2-oxoacid:ferredoxin oxidoreductase gamma subunit
MTLFDLLGYHIKANPKYGSEKKGQPTTYYLSVRRSRSASTASTSSSTS